MPGMARKVKVTLVRSPIHRTESQKETIKGLGLRKLHGSRVLQDTLAIRGMIRKVQHLVTVEPADESLPADSTDSPAVDSAGASQAVLPKDESRNGCKPLSERRGVKKLLDKAAKRFVVVMHHLPDQYLDAAMLGRVSGLAQHWDDLEEMDPNDEAADKLLFEKKPAYLPVKKHKTAKQTGGDKTFTIRQHLVPRTHIARFKPEGKHKVWSLFLKSNKIQEVAPKSEWFCASRLWSHVAEADWMWAIERLFLDLLPELPEVIIDPIAQDAISRYWGLCRSRIKVFGKQPKAFNFPDIDRQHYDDEARNKAEKLGLGLYSDRGDETRIVSASLVGLFMDNDVKDFRASGLRWSVIDVTGSLVLPDYWANPLIPVTPNRLLLGRKEGDLAREVLNRQAEAVNEYTGTHHGKNFIVSSSKEALLEIQKKRKVGSSV